MSTPISAHRTPARRIITEDTPLDVVDTFGLYMSLDSFLDWNTDDNERALSLEDLRSFGIWK